MLPHHPAAHRSSPAAGGRLMHRQPSCAAEQRDELAAPHVLPTVRESHPHRCRNAALCTTTKLMVEWQRWVKLSHSTMSAQTSGLPESGRRSTYLRCRTSATRRHMQCSKQALLFDHLVGAGEQPRRQGEAERFCRLQVDQEASNGVHVVRGRHDGPS
jgi:hypothetical protein